MDAKDRLLAKKLDEEVNNAMIIEVERQPIKKKQNVFSSKISKLFSTKLPYKINEM
jgi:hypothetical protein